MPRGSGVALNSLHIAFCGIVGLSYFLYRLCIIMFVAMLVSPFVCWRRCTGAVYKTNYFLDCFRIVIIALFRRHVVLAHENHIRNHLHDSILFRGL